MGSEELSAKQLPQPGSCSRGLGWAGLGPSWRASPVPVPRALTAQSRAPPHLLRGGQGLVASGRGRQGRPAGLPLCVKPAPSAPWSQPDSSLHLQRPVFCRRSCRFPRTPRRPGLGLPDVPPPPDGRRPSRPRGRCRPPRHTEFCHPLSSSMFPGRHHRGKYHRSDLTS